MRKQINNNLPQDSGNTTPPFSIAAIKKSLELTGKVVAPPALLGALLFYFGWVRTNALYLSFGIDQSLLQFTTQDYLLRSIQIVLSSLSTLLMITFVLIWVHHGVNLLRNYNRVWFIWIASLITLTGFVLVIISYLLPQKGNHGVVSILIPLLWSVGATLLIYGLSILYQPKMIRKANRKKTSLFQKFPKWLYTWSMGIIVMLLIVGIFSTTSIFANMLGQSQAEAIKANPGIYPAVIIYSRMPLMLSGTGITTETISKDPDTFCYRYQGLRFFVRSGGKYFLLPDLWENGVSHAIILPESDGIRVEVAP